MGAIFEDKNDWKAFWLLKTQGGGSLQYLKVVEYYAWLATYFLDTLDYAGYHFQAIL